MDFFTTFIGVGLLGMTERNIIVRLLYQNNEYLTILMYSLAIVPLIWLGIYNYWKYIFKAYEKFNKYFYCFFIIFYVYVLTNNIMELIFYFAFKT